LIDAFQDRIREAAARRAPLRIRGGGTKDFYGNALRGEVLDTRAYAGIVEYEPTELVVTARCGTPLAELETLLAENRQMLPFEPPHFGAPATVGGCVAAGLAGPRRAAAGALRDFVLGVKLIDGRGEVLRFGGKVMKNVAGYDVSRVMAGALGTLGLLAEVSLKLSPLPAEQATLRLEAPQARALEMMNRWAGQPLPISASAWHDDQLTLRLSGAAAAVRAAVTTIGGEKIDGAFWRDVREHADPFFAGEAPLWRLSVPPTLAPLELSGPQLIEWNGGLRWLKSTLSAGAVRDAARKAHGHATLFRGPDKSAGCFAPLDPVVERLHRGLKAAFDPAGIFNPGRLLPEVRT
jgi:glycolate oxidase FAD binding subunit